MMNSQIRILELVIESGGDFCSAIPEIKQITGFQKKDNMMCMQCLMHSHCWGPVKNNHWFKDEKLKLAKRLLVDICAEEIVR